MDKTKKFVDMPNDPRARYAQEHTKLPIGVGKLFESRRLFGWKMAIFMVPDDNVKIDVASVCWSSHPIAEITSKYEKSKDIISLTDNEAEDLMYGLLQKPKAKFKLLDFTAVKGKRKVDFNSDKLDTAMLKNPKYIEGSQDKSKGITPPNKKQKK